MQKLLRQSLKNQLQSSRCVWTNTYIQKPGSGIFKDVSLIPGAGIGPEICKSVQQIFQAVNAPVKFDVIDNFTFEDEKLIDGLHETILLGCPPKSKKGFSGDHHQFYKRLGLYAKVISAQSLPGIQHKHDNVDVIVIRERTQGEYTGIEHEVYPGVIESIKVTTKSASLDIAEFAFEFAYLSGRKKITAVHKANIMKLVDGVFLDACREVAKKYPFIKYEEMIVDNTSMQLVKTPQQFDVMLMPNLYGTIISNICCGITGGIGLNPGVHIGHKFAMFSQAVQNPAYKIAGKNIANPTALIYSSVMMLRHLNFPVFADRIAKGVNDTLAEGKVRTLDIGGKSTTEEYTFEIIKHISKQ